MKEFLFFIMIARNAQKKINEGAAPSCGKGGEELSSPLKCMGCLLQVVKLCAHTGDFSLTANYRIRAFLLKHYTETDLGCGAIQSKWKWQKMEKSEVYPDLET